MNLHCIGDSHCAFFLGYDTIPGEYPVVENSLLQKIYCYRLGSALAFNCNKYGTTTKSKEKIETIITNLDPQNDMILFSFGEIDCRAHILKQCEIKNMGFEKIVEECISNYWQLITEVHQYGFKIVIWNAVYSANYEERNPNLQYPYFGTVQQRNTVTEFFNIQLKTKANKAGIIFLDISTFLIDTSSKLTIESYYFDAVHLNNRLFLTTIAKINGFFDAPIFSKKQIFAYKMKLWRINIYKDIAKLLAVGKKMLKRIYGQKK